MLVHPLWTMTLLDHDFAGVRVMLLVFHHHVFASQLAVSKPGMCVTIIFSGNN